MSIFYVHFPQELICLNKTSKNQKKKQKKKGKETKNP